MSISALRERMHALLAQAQPSIPSREADLLLATACGLSEATLLAFPERTLDPDVCEQALQLANERANGRPFAYVVGQREFYGRSYRVDERVLIPRPETEHLVESVLELPLGPDARILDIGTGSGCIAITLALERPDWQVIGSDVSLAALAVAHHNGRVQGAGVQWVATDLTGGLPCGHFDVVVSNPPYVDREDANSYERSVAEHEPTTALFADAGGMALYRRLFETRLVRQVRFLALEIGAGQARRVRDLAEARFVERACHHDLAGHLRTLVFENRAPENTGRGR